MPRTHWMLCFAHGWVSKNNATCPWQTGIARWIIETRNWNDTNRNTTKETMEWLTAGDVVAIKKCMSSRLATHFANTKHTMIKPLSISTNWTLNATHPVDWRNYGKQIDGTMVKLQKKNVKRRNNINIARCKHAGVNALHSPTQIVKTAVCYGRRFGYPYGLPTRDAYGNEMELWRPQMKRNNLQQQNDITPLMSVVSPMCAIVEQLQRFNHNNTNSNDITPDPREQWYNLFLQWKWVWAAPQTKTITQTQTPRNNKPVAFEQHARDQRNCKNDFVNSMCAKWGCNVVGIQPGRTSEPLPIPCYWQRTWPKRNATQNVNTSIPRMTAQSDAKRNQTQIATKWVKPLRGTQDRKHDPWWRSWTVTETNGWIKRCKWQRKRLETNKNIIPHGENMRNFMNCKYVVDGLRDDRPTDSKLTLETNNLEIRHVPQQNVFTPKWTTDPWMLKWSRTNVWIPTTMTTSIHHIVRDPLRK